MWEILRWLSWKRPDCDGYYFRWCSDARFPGYSNRYGAGFYEMANAGSGNIDITLLSGGIYEAMITTVGGLIVGIIAMFAYNYLVMLVDRVVNKMESRTMEFMDLLNEPAQK